jgi:hypothetical protein
VLNNLSGNQVQLSLSPNLAKLSCKCSGSISKQQQKASHKSQPEARSQNGEWVIFTELLSMQTRALINC